MEQKKTSKKSDKTVELAGSSFTVSEAPLAYSKAAKRKSAAKSKQPVAAAAKPITTESSPSKNSTHRHSKLAVPHAPATSYSDVAWLAYHYWEERSYAHGFAEEDWHRAEATLKEHTGSGSVSPLRNRS